MPKKGRNSRLLRLQDHARRARSHYSNGVITYVAACPKKGSCPEGMVPTKLAQGRRKSA